MIKELVVTLAALTMLAACQEEKVRYDSCVEAEESGAAPMTAGEPGYALRLDANKDGVACE